MTVADLLKKLQNVDPNLSVMFTDGSGLRDLTGGPMLTTIKEDDAENCGDCEGRVGEVVVAVSCY